jgi:threonine/homoserine/homoserine lactone efflux protein
VGDHSSALLLFFRSILIGLSIAAPLGPIGVLCVRRTLAQGWTYGVATGFGAASADAIYAALASSGLVLVSAFLVRQQSWIHLVGGIFLCYLGVHTAISKPVVMGVDDRRDGLGSSYGTTFFLTITNPITIISFTGIFAGLGLVSMDKNFLSVSSTVFGVFVGSALWWLLLSSVVSLLRRRFGAREMLWVNRISGAIILAFGVIAIASLYI